MFQVRQAGRHYYVELVGATALYVGSMFWRRSFVHAHPDPSLWRSLVVLSPLVPILLMAAAMVRFYWRIDEMQRRHFLEAIAFGSLVCALGSLVLGFMSDVGLPDVGISWAWPLMAVGWLAFGLWRAASLSIADRGPAATLRFAATALGIVAVPALAYMLVAAQLGWPQRPATALLGSMTLWFFESFGKLLPLQLFWIGALGWIARTA